MKWGTLKSWLLRVWRSWGRDITLVLAIMIPFRSSIADWNVVPTGSMKPTILEGDRIFVNKLAYDLKIPLTTKHIARWADPQRGDIVVFFSPKDDTRLVKRVIGLPSDVVTMKNNRLLINGIEVKYERPKEDVAAGLPDAEKQRVVFAEELLNGTRHPVMITPGALTIRTFGPVTVPEGHYLLLGDNRDNSADSRFFGFVERDRIVGKAPAIVLSLDPKHYYLPRRNRFFAKLR